MGLCNIENREFMVGLTNLAIIADSYERIEKEDKDKIAKLEKQNKILLDCANYYANSTHNKKARQALDRIKGLK